MGLLPRWVVVSGYLHARLRLAAFGCHTPMTCAEDLEGVASQTTHGTAVNVVPE